MRRIVGVALLLLLTSVALTAAKNSRTFYLSTAVRAGNVQLPRGICEVTWSTPSGSRVRLNIKTEDQKTVKVHARVVEGNQGKTGVVTSVVDGVTYLQELHTSNATFLLQSRAKTSK